jgi:oxygen-dependent protoporphyrinogen oxidase
VLGTVWNSALFPGRVPEGTTLLTSFIGGATDPSAGALPEEALFQAVETELRRILGITFAPRVRFTQRWTRALPQYTLGHGQRLAAVRAALERVPGVFLTGNYLAGPSVGACVEHASQVAQQVYEYWRTTK